MREAAEAETCSTWASTSSVEAETSSTAALFSSLDAGDVLDGLGDLGGVGGHLFGGGGVLFDDSRDGIHGFDQFGGGRADSGSRCAGIFGLLVNGLRQR